MNKNKKNVIFVILTLCIFVLASCNNSKSTIKNLGSEYFTYSVYKNDTDDLNVTIPILLNKKINNIEILDIDGENNEDIISYSLADEFYLLHTYSKYHYYNVDLIIKTKEDISKLKINIILTCLFYLCSTYCNLSRVIILDEGNILYDGLISNIKTKFGDMRHITILTNDLTKLDH